MAILLGPILGHVSDREARIWFRASDAQPYQVDVRRASGTRVPGSPFQVVPGGHALTVTAVVPLPVPYATYTYDIIDAAGQSVLPGLPARSFASAPLPDTSGPLRFGVISCNKMTRDAYLRIADRELMWQRLRNELEARDAALLLAVGDQVYCDDAFHSDKGRNFPPTLRRAYWRCYQQHWDHDAVRSVLASLPTYMTWDDHEIRNGWGSDRRDSTAQNRRVRFEVAREVYREFQHSHNPAPSPPFGPKDLAFGFRYGDVGFLFLDLRGHRNRQRRARPVLGTAQWRKIRTWLARESPDLGALFVVSSVPPIHVKGLHIELGSAFITDLQDQWSIRSNRPELKELLGLLFDIANERDIPVVLLGGDVHVGTIAAIRSHQRAHERRPLLYQLTSSPISNKPAPDVILSQVGRTVNVDDEYISQLLVADNQRNFGMVELKERPRGGYQVALELHWEEAERADRVAVP